MRTNSSSNDSLSTEQVISSKEDINKSKRLSPIPSASILINKELPIPPQKTSSKDEKKITVLPQQPPSLPPRNSTSSPIPSQPPYQPQSPLPSQPPYQSQSPIPSQPPYQPQSPLPSQPPYQPQSMYPQPPYQPQPQASYVQMFPNMPQFTNPQEFQPSAPAMDDLEAPPPYEYNPNNEYNNLPEKH
ncbi:hypothetical protein PIROE2DRAFT_61236 [Piromyces sp. E2]|nr:hypothetical protein PIROE2DRAFT_61236 [Piromyces sp. E2]|eukprot:OUM63512.1 hypothetical protein PIROE2DRAFT_61236 [Piromyces sp. E2]